MTSSTPFQEMLDEALRIGLSAVLRADGYRKDRRTFLRRAPQVVLVVGIQSSKWNTASDGQFTVNLGAYVPSASLVAGERLLARPKPHQCQLWERLGMLRSGRDDWWSLRKGESPEAVAADVVEAWNEVGRAWTERHADPRECIATLDRTGREETAAYVALGIGDTEGARERVNRVMKACRMESHRFLVLAFARRNGLVE